MTMREPFAKLSGTLGYIEVAGCWLVPTTHTIWPSAFVSKINATHEARVKEAVREAVAERDDRIAELEMALKRVSESLNVIVAWSGDCYCLTDYEAGIAGGKECPTCAAIEGLSEIKSVLGRK